MKKTPDEIGKSLVEFQTRNGNVTNAVEIYNDIDSLVNDTQRPNYGAINYRVATTPKVSIPTQEKPKFKKKDHNSVKVEVAAAGYEDQVTGGDVPGHSHGYLKQWKEMEAEQNYKILAQAEADSKVNRMIG